MDNTYELSVLLAARHTHVIDHGMDKEAIDLGGIALDQLSGKAKEFLQNLMHGKGNWQVARNALMAGAGGAGIGALSHLTSDEEDRKRRSLWSRMLHGGLLGGLAGGAGTGLWQQLREWQSPHPESFSGDYNQYIRSLPAGETPMPKEEFMRQAAMQAREELGLDPKGIPPVPAASKANKDAPGRLASLWDDVASVPRRAYDAARIIGNDPSSTENWMDAGEALFPSWLTGTVVGVPAATAGRMGAAAGIDWKNRRKAWPKKLTTQNVTSAQIRSAAGDGDAWNALIRRHLGPNASFNDTTGFETALEKAIRTNKPVAHPALADSDVVAGIPEMHQRLRGLKAKSVTDSLPPNRLRTGAAKYGIPAVTALLLSQLGGGQPVKNPLDR